ncbi:MAG: GNAT family N-acetyltransferase [Bacteroidota bacterium]|nr:GNAT family N-acetyltransferase [Bacteroidota bacterium]
MQIKHVNAKAVRPLRHLVLRTGKPFSTTSYDKDYDQNTFHLAYIKKNKIVVCTTFYPEATKEIDSLSPFRLRGMATHPDERRKGLGEYVMREAFKELHTKGCDLIWCNARLIAVDFYKSLAFKTKGELFNIGDIGPHYYMYRKITKIDLKL